jgi:hypothetical protein
MRRDADAEGLWSLEQSLKLGLLDNFSYPPLE